MKSHRAIVEAEFGRAILPLARRWRSAADRMLGGLGLSHASGWALLHVGRLGDTVRQSDLAAAADIRGPSLVPLLDRLEADRLITRKVEKDDRRVNIISLTDDGKALVGQIEDALRTLRRDTLAGINDEDLAIVARVLQQLDRRLVGAGEAA